MVPPCGYRCIGDVAVPSREKRPNRNHYCCINRQYIKAQGNELAWSNEGSRDMRRATLWWTKNKDESNIGPIIFLLDIFCIIMCS